MARAASRSFPEGELFTYEFFGLALANIAETTRAPGDIDKAISKGVWLLARIDESLEHASFRRRKDLPDRGGICWLGGRNLLLARLIRLSAERMPQRLVEQFHRDSNTLHSVFMAEPSGVPETFRGERWPVDGLFALESLRIHDEVYGTALSMKPIQRWVQTMRKNRDRSTGLMPSYVNASGRARDVPRGCALSWSLSVLPRLDPVFAAEQWLAYKQHFLGGWLGLPAFREYPIGVERSGDIDSGPIVGGLGMSATAFGLAAARANGDLELAEKLERLGEVLGMPVSDQKGKRYLLGKVPFFDVLALWTKTVPVPGRPAPQALLAK
ncbi:MAG: hypothetical protein ACT4TC_11465 [Myxococcaceae bacterium]